jgi:hypothetical protein
VAGTILLSRPGHWALLLGQPAILLTVLAYLAFLYGQTGPALAGLALSGALFKPNYGVPLALLLWAWGRARTAALGIGLAVLLNLPLLGLLAEREGGFIQLLSSARKGYQGWQNLPDVNPATSNTRTDAASLISRFLGTPLSSMEQALLAVAVLLLCVAVLRPLAKHRTPQADTLAIGIICLATNIVGFHRGYDLVLLSLPFIAAVVPGSLPAVSRGVRITIIALFSVLALNWAVTESVLAYWQPSRPEWLAATSVNGLCLVLLLGLYLALGTRYPVGTREEPIR